MSSFDVIGDIHGHADALVALLKKLGYRETGSVWRHPERTAVFVGDYIDRGPKQLETVQIVRRMVDAGSAYAIMGNHEFNAIAWFLPDPDRLGEHLRPRSGKVGSKNRDQHKEFLAQVGEDSAKHRDCVDWFMTLPLWLDLGGIRVVHASWHEGFVAELAPRLRPGARLDEDLMVAASQRGSRAFLAIEGLAKGLEIALSDGHSFKDKDGHERRSVRTRWWDTSARTYREVALVDEDTRLMLPDAPMPEGSTIGYASQKPVFFGHYWLRGTPRPFTDLVACVDYSIAKGGVLCAYRWEGEPRLSADKFVSVR